MTVAWFVLAVIWWIAYLQVPDGQGGGWFLLAAVLTTLAWLIQFVHGLIQANRFIDEARK